MKYTQLIEFKDNEFDVETATTVEEAKELLKAGFDYITEKNGYMLFRRPKRFGPSMGGAETLTDKTLKPHGKPYNWVAF